jgi:hypothetical protein
MVLIGSISRVLKRGFNFEVQQTLSGNPVIYYLNCFTATRFRLRAQGCRFGYPGLQN